MAETSGKTPEVKEPPPKGHSFIVSTPMCNDEFAFQCKDISENLTGAVLLSGRLCTTIYETGRYFRESVLLDKNRFPSLINEVDHINKKKVGIYILQAARQSRERLFAGLQCLPIRIRASYTLPTP